MIITLQPGLGASLRDVWNFRQFHVEVPTGARLAPPADLGRLAPDGQHVWVCPRWLASAGPDDADWRTQLEAMIAFARAKGWCDEAGLIRAHIATA